MRAQVAHKRTELLSDPATDERERKAKAALMTKIEAWLAEDVGESHAHSCLAALRAESIDLLINDIIDQHDMLLTTTHSKQ